MSGNAVWRAIGKGARRLAREARLGEFLRWTVTPLVAPLVYAALVLAVLLAFEDEVRRFSAVQVGITAVLALLGFLYLSQALYWWYRRLERRRRAGDAPPESRAGSGPDGPG